MENNNSTMIGLKEEDEVELELGLSIGGTLKKAEKLKPIKKDTARNQPCTSDTKPNNISTDLRDYPRSFVRDVKQGGSVVLYPLTKSEIHALRRQEAKKKREEKQQKKGTYRAKNGVCPNVGFSYFDVEERECKKNKVEDYGSGNNEMKNVNLNLSIDHDMNQNVRSNPNPPAGPGLTFPYSYSYMYPMTRYAPFSNGFANTCVNAMPFWPTGGCGTGNGRNVVQPVGNRSFRADQDSGLNVGNGCDSEQNSGRSEGVNRKTASNGPPIFSSSVVSDHQSSSPQAGSSSDRGTHSSLSKSEHLVNRSVVSNKIAQTEHSASSHQMESTQSVNKEVPLNVTISSPSVPKEKAISETQPASSIKSNTENSAGSPTPMTETKGEMIKPPKPQTQNNNTPSLPHMPCVSTTGNGPNGKTINGFLYRYTKSEISIICVCHGSSFSPAEFVQHAGGIDVSHPLRHITVIPAAF